MAINGGANNSPSTNALLNVNRERWGNGRLTVAAMCPFGDRPPIAITTSLLPPIASLLFAPDLNLLSDVAITWSTSVDCSSSMPMLVASTALSSCRCLLDKDNVVMRANCGRLVTVSIGEFGTVVPYPRCLLGHHRRLVWAARLLSSIDVFSFFISSNLSTNPTTANSTNEKKMKATQTKNQRSIALT